MLALAKLSIQTSSGSRTRRLSSSPTASPPPLVSLSPRSAHGTHPLFSDSALEVIRRSAWPVFASLSWGFVMYLFRWYPDTIQPSLRSSMKYMCVVLVTSGEVRLTNCVQLC